MSVDGGGVGGLSRLLENCFPGSTPSGKMLPPKLFATSVNVYPGGFFY
jgi:hypothetical protein